MLLLCCRPREYGERDPEASAAGQQGLAGLFEPPHDILFKGSFEEAKEAAQGQERWLVILSSFMPLCQTPCTPVMQRSQVLQQCRR